MARNGSGTYSLPAGNPVVSGETIDSTWANDTMDDIELALTQSLDRNGNGAMLAALEAFAGTKSAPGVSWSDEATTGWYRAGASDIRFSLLNTDVLQIKSNVLNWWDGAAWQPFQASGDNLTTDQIDESTATAGVTIDGALIKDGGFTGEIITDTISEETPAAGVTIDSLLVKDGGAVVSAGDIVVNDNQKISLGTAGAEADFYSDGTDAILDIVGTGDYEIRDGGTLRYTFQQDGDFVVASRRTFSNLYGNSDNTEATAIYSNDLGNTNATGVICYGASHPTQAMTIRFKRDNFTDSAIFNSDGDFLLGPITFSHLANYTSFVASGTTGAQLRLQYGGTDSGRIIGTSVGFYMWQDSAMPLIFGTNNTEDMRLKSGGTLNFSNMPSGASEPGGLAVGDLWVDTGDSTVKMKLV